MSSQELDDLGAAAARLAAQPIIAIHPSGEGANSRIYRVDLATGPVALKIYPSRPGDTRDRLETEWNTLTFLRSRGVDSVPAALARDHDLRLMLMEWIDGDLAIQHRPSELVDALSFMSCIFELSEDPAAQQFHLASEACLSAAEIIRQIDARLTGFASHGQLELFLKEEFGPAYAAAKAVIATGPDEEHVLAAELRRLIPADFGFHNALRQHDGRLRFIDFDYFGWDDPVKLTADFILHPAMALSQSDCIRVAKEMTAARAADPGFAGRLQRYMALYALRWSLILLNPFRLDRRRSLPVESGRLQELMSAQLAKARLMLTHVYLHS